MQPMTFKSRFTSLVSQTNYLTDDDTRKSGVPRGLSKKIDYAEKSLTISGTPAEAGDFRILVSLSGLGGEKVTDTLLVHVTAKPTGICEVPADQGCGKPSLTDVGVFDLQGRRLDNGRRGLFIMRRGDKMVKVVR